MNKEIPSFARELSKRFASEEPTALKLAEARYADHDCRFVDDEAVRTRFFDVLERVRDCLASDEQLLPPSLFFSDDLRRAVAAAVSTLCEERPRSEERFEELGIAPPLVMALGQVLGIFREDYLAFVDSLPPSNAYAPGYVNMGPSGRCNVRCPTCLLGGALRRYRRSPGLDLDDVMRHLRDAEDLDITGLSMCIGEPTADPELLWPTLRTVRASSQIRIRSFITNGLFAKTIEGARTIWRGVLENLGEQRSTQCLFAFSANDELEGQGISPETTANAIQAFVEIMPNRHCVLQFIRSDTWRDYRNRVLGALEARGLYTPVAESGEHDGIAPPVKLAGNFTMVSSVMAKFPPVNTTEEVEHDPYVFYIRSMVPEGAPFPGMFMSPTADLSQPEPPAEDEAITLGQDGQYYVDYHFMVRGIRPLGTSLAEAIESFRKDPILSQLKRGGGLNLLLDIYESIPPERRPIRELMPLVERCSTVSMVGADVIFADEDLALRLARELVSR